MIPKRLGRQYPEFDIVVTAGDFPELSAPTIKGTRTLLLGVGEKTMDAMVLAFYDPGQPPRYQRVPLDSRFDDKNHGSGQPPFRPCSKRCQLPGWTQGGRFRGTGARPRSYPKQELLGRFVGSEECKTCHEGSFIQWKKTPHSHAYRTLAKLPVPRVFDPECISCHVVGWDTRNQNFFPYQSGYRSLAATPQADRRGLRSRATGRARAHRRRERHRRRAAKEDPAVDPGQQRGPKDPDHPHRCQNCHDLDNSPDFKFEVYFPKDRAPRLRADRRQLISDAWPANA